MSSRVSGLVLRDGEPEPASIPGDIEDEIRRVGLARSERRSEWRGETDKAGQGCLTLRDGPKLRPSPSTSMTLRPLGVSGPFPRWADMVRSSNQGLYSSNDKFTVCRDRFASLGPGPRLFVRQGGNEQGGHRFRKNISSRRR